MLLTVDEVKKYLQVYYDEDNPYIAELIETSEDYLIDSIDNYSNKIINDRFRRKARICSLALIQECYDNRTLVSKDNDKLRFIISSFLMQMQYGNYDEVI